jgi:cysteine sulfinate desulfinase/cysteine desulfurase-like protein
MGCRPEVIASSVRFSLSFENTRDEIDDAVTRIAAAVARLRAAAGESRLPAQAGRQPEPISQSPA